MADWLVFERGSLIATPTLVPPSMPDGGVIPVALPIQHYRIFEPPWFYDQAATTTGAGVIPVKLAAVAIRPDPSHIGADVYVDNVLQTPRLTFQPNRIWVTEAFTKTSTQIKLSSAPLGNVLLINEEFVHITPTATAKTYDVARGLFDTLPLVGAVNDDVWDMSYLWLMRTGIQSRSANVKLVSRTARSVQATSNGVSLSVGAYRRATNPVVPANIKINNSHYPASVTEDITVNYAFRDIEGQLGDADHDWLTFGGENPPGTNFSVVVELRSLPSLVTSFDLSGGVLLSETLQATRTGSVTFDKGDVIRALGSNSGRLIVACHATRAATAFYLRPSTSYFEFVHELAWTGSYGNVLRFSLTNDPDLRPSIILRFTDQTPAAPVAPTYPQHLLMFTRLLVPPDFGPDYGPDQPGQPDMPGDMNTGWHYNWGNQWGT